MDTLDQGQIAAQALSTASKMLLIDVRHPHYLDNITLWLRYRDAYLGGSYFVNKYLQQYSARESATDFAVRKQISYCSAHAKAAINEIKNSISERLVDVLRQGGPASYNEAIDGTDGGVDYTGSSMNAFLGKFVIPDLLVVGKVGVYIDKDAVSEGATLLDVKDIRPYIYTYRAEDILTWTKNHRNELTKVLLLDTVEKTDTMSGLICGTKRRTRFLTLESDGVHVQLQDEDGTITNSVLKLSRIPFVIAELSDSLMADIADYQIALTNMASSDVNYTLRSNFPFYVEQTSPQAELANRISKAVTAEGSEVASDTGITIGSQGGRRYPMGVEAPSFIHPSSEPLRASMDKQEQLKTEIRQLVALALTNIKPQRASAESKNKDNQGLESGLAYIGMELQYLESQIAEIWTEYEDATESATVIYPDKYSMRSDEDRRAEAKELIEDMPKIPSLTYQKEIAKRVVYVLLGNKVDEDVLTVINKEIDAAKVVNIDPDVIAKDIENQLVSNATASLARLYPAGETQKAAKDHAERAMRIAAAQSSASVDAAARGIQDLAPSGDGAINEKATSQAAALQTEGGKAVRS